MQYAEYVVCEHVKEAINLMEIAMKKSAMDPATGKDSLLFR